MIVPEIVCATNDNQILLASGIAICVSGTNELFVRYLAGALLPHCRQHQSAHLDGRSKRALRQVRNANYLEMFINDTAFCIIDKQVAVIIR